MLRVYCSNCENIIRNICRANTNKRIFKVIDDWLNQLTKVPIDRIRDVLYNIEQFKADSLILPEIKTSQKNKGGDKDDVQAVYGAGAKSAGSISADSSSKGANKMLGNGGRTSLTGKNPFAILKASAIASNT